LVPVLANIPALLLTGFPTSDTILWIPAILLLGPIGMYFGIVAVKHANTSMLGPYTFLRLVIGVLGGVAIFHELPDIFSACGAVLILGGCVLASCVSKRLHWEGAIWVSACRLRHRLVASAAQPRKTEREIRADGDPDARASGTISG